MKEELKGGIETAIILADFCLIARLRRALPRVMERGLDSCIRSVKILETNGSMV